MPSAPSVAGLPFLYVSTNAGTLLKKQNWKLWMFCFHVGKEPLDELGNRVGRKQRTLQSVSIRIEKETARDTIPVYQLIHNELARILFPNLYFQERNLHQFPTLLHHFSTISPLLQELKWGTTMMSHQPRGGGKKKNGREDITNISNRGIKVDICFHFGFSYV